MRKIRILVLALLAAPSLSGCLVIGAGMLAADVAVSTTGTVLETAGNVGKAAIDVVTPGDDEDDED